MIVKFFQCRQSNEYSATGHYAQRDCPCRKSLVPAVPIPSGALENIHNTHAITF